MSGLSIQALKKTYGTNLILKGVSLEAGRGEFLSLLGPSGSGKTTLLRCIAGLERPDADSGPVSLEGRELSNGMTFMPPEQRRLGMVFQSYAVWPHMTVLENVLFPLQIQARRGELKRAEIEPKAREVISLVRLSHLERRYPSELSGGQQQRVALARALAMSPRLLLLDEPLSNLDALLRDELGAEIRKLQKALDLTTILVTHDQKEALSLSDRIIVLNEGRIDCEGMPEELYFNPPTPFAAQFLSGGQRIGASTSGERMMLPRRWELSDASDSASGAGASFRVSARIFRGNEYEYLAEGEGYSEPIRFFSSRRLEAGQSVALVYRS